MFKTKQEEFWAGDFGDAYAERNNGEKQLAVKIAMFSRYLQHTLGVKSCLELGANIGLNLIALSSLLPGIKMSAVEINQKAADECRKIHNVDVFCGSIFDYPVKENAYDLAFTHGVLIHIAPEKLRDVYEILYKSAKRYILISEYYNPTPMEVTYRGNEGKLFKRDFSGEMLETYPDLRLLDYGFFYHRDNNFPVDDITWFLMEKA